MRKFFYLLLAIILTAGTAVGINSFAAKPDKLYSVEMSVSRMTCGSCIETIREAVTGLPGTEKVRTDLRSARSYVEYDAERADAGTIAEAVTASGYPATVLFVRNDAGKIVSGIDLGKYVARVGSRLIGRDVYDRAFREQFERAETTGNPLPPQALSREAWNSILRRELLLNAAEQFEVSVSDQTVTDHLAEAGNSNSGTDRNDLKIESYLERQFPDGKPNAMEMRNLLNALYSNTAVDIFDSNLKRYLSVQSGSSGCGGSCCG